jgi:hypothetical protein
VRKLRFLAVALIATLGVAAVAVAQTTTTQYAATGSVSAHGGSKSKPKAGSLKFGFTVTDPTGVQPPPLQTYSILFEGGRLNTQVAKSCPAAKINAANGDDSVCPSGSKIGSGSLDSLIGTTGQPSETHCKATLTIYGAGKGKATLMVRSTLATCVTELHQAIDMKYITSGGYSGLQFTVPDELRHQLGLDITVIKADTTINKMTKKGKNLVESTGCKTGTRHLKVTFTDEQGGQHPVTTPIGKC